MTDPSNRDSYHHGDLRQAILEAACQHLRRENADTLSLRALARAIGVSQTAPYRHFDSKNALFAAIATWGFNILQQQILVAARIGEGNGRDGLIQICLSYLEFAETHYEKYQLFFDSSLVDFDEYEELQIAGTGCFEVMLGQIRRGIDSGWLPHKPPEELASIVWSSLHGVASLLQMNYEREGFRELSVGKAVGFLATNRAGVVETLVCSIERPAW